jgi:hypothetical protein
MIAVTDALPLLAPCLVSPPYEPVTVCAPRAVGVYVTEQRPVPSSVQLAPFTKSPLSALKLTVPVGVDAPAPAVSATVAVQVVVRTTLFGEQLTLVLVVRMIAVTGLVPLLVA